MKRTIKRILSSVLTVIMLLSVVPIGNLYGLDFGLEASAAVTYYWPVTTSVDYNHNYVFSSIPSGSTQIHGGLDFPVGIGSPVYASAAGTVMSSSVDIGCTGSHLSGSPKCTTPGCTSKSYNNVIYIQHSDGNVTLYAHLKTGSFLVKAGDTVQAGQQIAQSGVAGKTTGPHLHFEIRKNNKFGTCDPANVLVKENVTPNSGNISFRNLEISNITHNNATISTWISNAENNQIWTTGFYFGTDPNNLHLFVAYEHIYWTDFHCVYDLSSYYGVLTPDTTYYYKFYVVEANDFKFHQTELKSFKTTGTKSPNISFHDLSISDINNNNAIVSTWISNAENNEIWSTGIFVGTNPADMTLFTKYEHISWTNFHCIYNLNDYYGQLSPGTTYYYRFYVIEKNNFTYSLSDVYSFTTTGYANATFRETKSHDVLSLDASIETWVDNEYGYNIESYGFYFGDNPSDMTLYIINQDVAWTCFHVDTTVAKYCGTLSPNKTYYYRFYVLMDGYYYSDIYSFTTDSKIPVFNITFNANGGTTPTASKSVTYNSTYGTLPTPTRTGYAFKGWYTAASGGTKVTTDTKVTVTANQTLYAQWTPNTDTKYVVNHYQMNVSGSGYTLKETENKTGTTASSVTIANLKKTYTGFTYEGGKGATSATATKPSTLDTTTTVLADGTRVINIYYSRNKYALTLNKGTGISAVSGAGTYYYGQSITIDATVSTGYTWSKWSDGNTTKKATITMPANALTITANATLNSYTISYTLNGGTVATANPTSYNVTTAAFTLNNPTRTGYTFAGWTGTGLSAATKTVTVAKGSTGNRTYTATWTPNTSTKYVVNHYQMNVSGSGYTLKETENKTGTTASSVTIANLKKTYTGFTYEGGKGATSATATKPSTLDTTTTVLADGTRVINIYYSRNKYALTLNKGTGISAVSGAGTYYYGQSVTIDATVATGYTWSKWSDGNTTKKATITMPANALTLTANATLNNYTISYTLNGGTVATANPTSYNVTTASFTLNNPTRTGYTFAGWTGTGLSAATKTVTVAKGSTGNRTYTATWTANTYTVTFNANGGTTPTASKTVTYDSTYGTLPTPTRTGYTFNGWYTATSGGTKVTADTKVTTASNHTLYAQWTANGYTIAFNGNGAISGSMSNLTMTYGTAKNLTANAFARTGYTFNGWNTKADGSGTSYADKVSVNNLTSTKDATVTLYAQWKCSHSYTSAVTKAATCTADGVRTYTCQTCGHSYTEAIAKIGHSYKSVATAPTCTKDGYTTHTCANCNDSYTDSTVKATGHKWNDATCTVAKTCSVCGTTSGSALGHSYTSAVTKAATCTADGVRTYTCQTCKHSYTEAIAKIGHNYKSVVTAPTCTTDGYTTHTCENCNDSYIDSKTVMTGHTFGDWFVVREPSCTTSGVDRRKCSECGEIENRVVKAYGHLYEDDYTIDIEATFTSTGSKSIHCVLCDSRINVTEIPKAAQNCIVDNGFVYGFASGLTKEDLLKDHFNNNAGTITISNTVAGTGTVVTKTNGIGIKENLSVVIFGDVNGDSWYDGQDAVLVSCLANGMLTKDDVSEAVYMAADCNHDGVIDQLDVDLLNEAGALLANVDQSKPTEELLETSSAYVEYLDLIDQSPEIEIEDDTEIDAEPNIPESSDTEEEGTHEEDTENSGSTDFDFIDMIMNFIKSIFEMLIAYIPGLYS